MSEEVYPAVRRTKYQNLVFSPTCQIVFPDMERENMEDFRQKLDNVQKRGYNLFTVNGCTFNLQSMTAFLRGIRITPTQWIVTRYVDVSQVVSLGCTREDAITALEYVYHMAN